MNEIVRSFVDSLAQELHAPIYEFGSFQVEGQEWLDLRNLFPGRKYTGCDVRPGPGVDLILDLHRIDLPDSSAETVLILETLEHVEFCREAISEIYRILRPGGVAVASSPMNLRIHEYPSDYWRFTPAGIKSLFRDFQHCIVESVGKEDFPDTVVAVGFKGEVPQARRQAIGEKIRLWRRARMEAQRPNALKEVARAVLPPALLDVYRKLRR